MDRFFQVHGALHEFIIVCRQVNAIGFSKADGMRLRMELKTEEEAQRTMFRLIKKVYGDECWYSWEDQLLVQIVKGSVPPIRIERSGDFAYLGAYEPYFPLIRMDHGSQPTHKEVETTFERLGKLRDKVMEVWKRRMTESEPP